MSQPMPKTKDVPDAVRMQDLLHRMAREMRIGAAIADDCQDAISEDARLEIDAITAMRLQGLDLLSQQLIELGRLLDRLAAESAAATAPGAAFDDINLSDLKQRLVGLNLGGVRVVEPELW